VDRLSASLVLVWGLAGAEANAARHERIEPAHLLLGLCKVCDVSIDDVPTDEGGWTAGALKDLRDEVDELLAVTRRAGLGVTPFRRRLRAELGVGPAEREQRVIHRSDQCRRVFRRAADLATGRDLRPRLIHLLQAVLEVQAPPWQDLLAEMGVHNEELLEAARAVPAGARGSTPRAQDVCQSRGRPRTDEQGEHAGPVSLPTLEQYGQDLTRLAAEDKLDPVIGRKEEIRRLARVLVQKKKNSAILIGDAGVGKTAVVEGLAQRMVAPDVHSILRGKRLISLTMAGLVAGTKYRGEFEERLRQVLEEATSTRDVILFIDEIHTVMGAGAAEGAMDAANVLKPALSSGSLQCIGATTTTEYRRHIEKDTALRRRFQAILVDEPTPQEALTVLEGLRPAFQEYHLMSIADEALGAAVEMSVRYLTDARLPDKAIDLIDQACARARLATLSGRTNGSEPMAGVEIGRGEIAGIISERTGIPVGRLTESEAQRLLHMEEALGRRVMGQDQAILALSDAVRTARAGLRAPHRPAGVFLFAGATGTGKTELAKALAEFLFDSEDRLIRFDMSEYMEKHAVARLVGAPPGYVGYEEEGQLTGPVRTSPYCVLLFDEVEKAHPDVLNIFLQMFDGGILTDAQGRRASFGEAVIVMTSNLGTTGAQEGGAPMGFARTGRQSSVEDEDRRAYREGIMLAVRQALRPELLNRIPNTIVFYPLARETVRRIIDKILGRVRERLAGRSVELQLAAGAYELLMEQGFSERYGAREMERAVDRLLLAPLSRALLQGRFADGDAIAVDRDGDELVLAPAGKSAG
jgi:ATP-dependent Clp protease ATP-binding subunit ClpC